MKILGLIPARGGSKGVPGKNTKLLGGKPLLQYTSDVALSSKLLSKVVLSSDDDRIIKIASELGVEVPFKRPSNLAEDTSPTLPVIKHTLEYFESIGVFFDAVCLLQVTSPFRSLEFLEQALKKFTTEQTDSLVSVLEVPHEYNPHWVFEQNSKGHLKIATGDEYIISRRQDLPKAYHRDGSIYITKTSVIKEQDSLYGNSTSFVVSDATTYVNIDTLKDWKIAESLMKHISDVV